MKRLYRSPEEKKIAGVCSGLGEYFDVDPVFFRVGFVVLVFAGGTGVIAYLAMAFLVPIKGRDLSPVRAPRLHLSRSDRKIAGVCGGLGEHLDIDPVFLRVLFVVLAFMAGLGIILYLVLWLALPSEEPQEFRPGQRDGG
ncbi:MAG TPA: PspC domain-containing protein [Fimbriimonadales bacterium]|nr:PspC domain-containing protein [Fimbriimonadales bacterium]